VKQIIKYILSTSFVFFISTIQAYSGTVSNLNVIGFSNDGRYIAYELYGQQDGSGFNFSTLRFVDVLKNDYTEEPLSIIDKNYSTKRSTMNSRILKKGNTFIKKYGIIENNRGTKIYQAKENFIKNRSRLNVKFKYNWKTYTLMLKEITAKNKHCSGTHWGETKILELRLNNGRNSKLLQRDKALYKSRNCSFKYGIDSVYVYGNKIVVFVGYWSPGFEGPDTNRVVVTGIID